MALRRCRNSSPDLSALCVQKHVFGGVENAHTYTHIHTRFSIYAHTYTLRYIRTNSTNIHKHTNRHTNTSLHLTSILIEDSARILCPILKTRPELGAHFFSSLLFFFKLYKNSAMSFLNINHYKFYSTVCFHGEQYEN